MRRNMIIGKDLRSGDNRSIWACMRFREAGLPVGPRVAVHVKVKQRREETHPPAGDHRDPPEPSITTTARGPDRRPGAAG
jgi:hypothetical protein